MSRLISHSQDQMILILSKEWGRLIHELSEAAKNANAMVVRTDRGPPAEDILLGDMAGSPMSPTFPKQHIYIT